MIPDDTLAPTITTALRHLQFDDEVQRHCVQAAWFVNIKRPKVIYFHYSAKPKSHWRQLYVENMTAICSFYPRPVLACPHDNSPLIQATTTKFGTKVQKTLVKVPYVFGHDRPWLSRSNLTWKSNFTSFWACPPHNSSAVQARISKFGPQMHLSTVKIPINFGLDWFWSSLSFSILKPIFLPNLFALFLYHI